jgi:EamA domain-containing membrane protein RarD
VFLAILAILIVVRLLGLNFKHFTQVTFVVLILAAVVFVLDAVYSKKKKK